MVNFQLKDQVLVTVFATNTKESRFVKVSHFALSVTKESKKNKKRLKIYLKPSCANIISTSFARHSCK